MTRRWIAILAIGCDGGAVPPKTPEPPSARATSSPGDAAAAALVVDAAVVEAVADAGVDASRAADVRPAVRAAPPWIGRVYSSNPKLGRETVGTYTLQREGDQALVTLELRRLSVSMMDGPGAKPGTTREEWGLQLRQKGATIMLAPLDGGEPAPFHTCKPGKIRVAAATAQIDTLRDEDCGGDTGWKPRGTKQVAVLLCGDDADGVVAFAPAPGVEFVNLHGDCVIGDGYRAIAKDGAVEPP